MFNFNTVLRPDFKSAPTLANAPLKGPDKLELFEDRFNRYTSAPLHIMDTALSLDGVSRHRRTDAELERDTTGLNKSAEEYQHRNHIPLPQALSLAESSPGVYILRLDGKVMKCGRASYSQGVPWRLRQYYNLNYDDRARGGEHWSVSRENRDRVSVSWQCCPPSKCHELEYKLFRKYGKGPWANRAPDYCAEDSWRLLI